MQPPVVFLLFKLLLGQQALTPFLEFFIREMKNRQNRFEFRASP